MRQKNPQNILLFLTANTNNSQNIDKKEYRAGTGNVIVLDKQKEVEEAAIDLTAKEGDFTVEFIPHDIKMTHDKKQVWVTANASQEQLQAMSKALVEKTKRDVHVMMATDQIVVIDTNTDKIISRIQIGVGLGLADLIIGKDSKYAYVAAEEGNAIYKVNTSTHKVDLIQLPPESKPHQLALSTDGTKLYARNQANSNVYFISTRTNEVRNQEGIEETKSLNWSGH